MADSIILTPNYSDDGDFPEESILQSNINDNDNEPENPSNDVETYSDIEYEVNPELLSPKSIDWNTKLEFVRAEKRVFLSKSDIKIQYSNLSKRNRIKEPYAYLQNCFASTRLPVLQPNPNRKELQDDLAVLDGWDKYETVCLDGANATGKSTLASGLRRTYIKLNQMCPDITVGSSYNWQPLKALDYIISHCETWYHHSSCSFGEQSCNEIYDQILNGSIERPILCPEPKVVWDRHPLSNFTYSMCHNLMSHFEKEGVPGPYDVKVYEVLDRFSIDTGFLKTAAYFRALYDIPTIFFVCSDVEITARALLTRGGINDCYNAAWYDYQMAQYHAYVYIANFLRKPIFDIAEIMHKYSMTLTDFQNEIAARIDVPEDVVYDKSEVCVHHFSREPSIFIDEFLKSTSDTLVFDFSTK